MAIDEIIGDDENKKLMLKQIAIGSVSGWLTGYISMKVGKVAAVAVGGGLILLQVANTKGYIKINWNRLSRDVDQVKSRIQEEAGGKKADWADKLEKKTNNLVSDTVSKQRRFFQSIVGTDNEDRLIKDVVIYSCSYVLGFGIGVVTGN